MTPKWVPWMHLGGCRVSWESLGVAELEARWLPPSGVNGKTGLQKGPRGSRTGRHQQKSKGIRGSFLSNCPEIRSPHMEPFMAAIHVTTCGHTSSCTYMYNHTWPCTWQLYIYSFMCLYIYIYVYTHICIYMYI